MKVLIIIPYFGSLPPWINYFLRSCKFNPAFNWQIFTDNKNPSNCPSNVKFTYLTLSEFNNLASGSLSLNIRIIKPYKICDLKPAFGDIFKDYIYDYNFWGISDIDMIYGNISKFLSTQLFNTYDIITSREEYFPGHFSLFRNKPLINNLYKYCPDYKKIFQDSNKHYAFDERTNYFGKYIFANNRYPINNIFSNIENGLNHIKIRIYHKRKNQDMTQIIQEFEGQDNLKLYRKNMVRSDNWFTKKRIENWEIKWAKGKLTDMIDNEELLHFHFLKSKKKRSFSIESCQPGNTFYIRKTGISFR